MSIMEQDVKQFKRQAIKAAKDFNYGDEVISKLKAAKTVAEMDRIMRTARKEKFK
jgi:hypothetical protein